ncbi:hypothetical protein ABZU94_13300 [Streptomyces mirabilis]|uniref:hypothetical protein n=1 Tax=Streptomyces sp. NPDC005388 TaxID=3156717 RepID=UPI0033A1A826
MAFYFEFTKPCAGAEISLPADPLEEGGGYEYFVMYACDRLAQTDCEFRIGGFGLEDWGFDVAYDMSSFLEELPALIEGVCARQDVDLFLYPQGVERTLFFSGKGSVISIRCESDTEWKPFPSVEEIPRQELIAMLRSFARDFSESLLGAAPLVAHQPPFEQWRNAVETAIPAD